MTPNTFKDWLRLRYSNFLIASGISVGAGVVGIVAILTFLDWPAARYEQIIRILGWLAIGGGILMAMVIAFLGLGGPAKSLSLKARDIELSTQGDDDCE